MRLELEELLLEALQQEELADIHLAAPEPLNWSDMDGFRFSTQPTGVGSDRDPRITTYLATKAGSEINISALQGDKMFAIGASTAQTQESWPIYRCLVYQIEHEGQLYVLSGGDWFRVNLEFKERVYNDVERLASEMSGLPDADHGTSEADYNVKAATVLEGLCLDRKLVNDGGPDSIEICDILTRSGGFIHVKHRGSSSTLSHLFAQGLNSAERLLEDDEFRRSVREIATATNPDFAEIVSEARPNAGDHEITFVVITRSNRSTPLTLPFFSVVNLRAAAIRLRAMGFQVSVAAVRELADAA